MRIGTLAQRIGLATGTIRYYEQSELIDSPLRDQKAPLEDLILEAGRLRDAIDQALATTERGTVAADQCQLIELGFGAYERIGTGS